MQRPRPLDMRAPWPEGTWRERGAAKLSQPPTSEHKHAGLGQRTCVRGCRTSTCSPCPGRAGGVTFKSPFYGLCIYLSYISSNPFSGAMRLCPKQLRGGVGCCYGGGLVDPSKSCCCCNPHPSLNHSGLFTHRRRCPARASLRETSGSSGCAKDKPRPCDLGTQRGPIPP